MQSSARNFRSSFCWLYSLVILTNFRRHLKIWRFISGYIEVEKTVPILIDNHVQINKDKWFDFTTSKIDMPSKTNQSHSLTAHSNYTQPCAQRRTSKYQSIQFWTVCDEITTNHANVEAHTKKKRKKERKTKWLQTLLVYNLHLIHLTVAISIKLQ